MANKLHPFLIKTDETEAAVTGYHGTSGDT